MSKYKVYRTTNLLTGEVYIGATSKDTETYYGSGPDIKNSIKALGAEHFTREILSTHDTPGLSFFLLINIALPSGRHH